MTLTLHLTPEMEAKLRELSASSGRMPEELALNFLERDLEFEVQDSGPAISYEEWSKHFDSWVKEQRSRNPHFDDSRESIYPDRV